MKNRKKMEARLNEIAGKRGGKITPDEVVQDAKSKTSPLHDYFQWDNTKAAHAYRLDQARNLISSVMIVFIEETRTITGVGYVQDPHKEKNTQGYVQVTKIRGDAEATRDVLIEEFKRAGIALQRAQRLAMIFGMEEEVEQLVKQVDARRKSIEEYHLSS